MLGGEIPARTTERIIMADEEAKVTAPEVEAPVAKTEEKFAKIEIPMQSVKAIQGSNIGILLYFLNINNF